MTDERRPKGERWPSFLGLFVLLPAVVADVVVFALTSRGRDAWVEVARLSTAGTAFVVAILGSFGVAHAVLAIRAARRSPRDAGPFGDVGHRRLQWLTALLVACFLPVHVLRHSPVAAAFFDVSLVEVYERMRSELSRLPWLAFYVFGFAALAVHAFQGLEAAISRFGGSIAGPARRLLHGAAFAFSFVLLAAAFHGLSHFATGRTQLPEVPASRTARDPS